MTTRFATIVLSCLPVPIACATTAVPEETSPLDPAGELVGTWAMDGFVVGVTDGKLSMVGVGGYSGPKCGDVSLARSADGAVTFTASCEAAGDYSFRLTRGSEPQSYRVTVKSRHGISIDDFPVAYADAKGWQGARDQLVDGETVNVTAAISPIEGRNWRGWRIQVLPPAAVEKDAKPEDLKKPYFMADLTRRK